MLGGPWNEATNGTWNDSLTEAESISVENDDDETDQVGELVEDREIELQILVKPKRASAAATEHQTKQFERTMSGYSSFQKSTALRTVFQGNSRPQPTWNGVQISAAISKVITKQNIGTSRKLTYVS